MYTSGILAIICYHLLTFVNCQSVPGATYFKGNGAPGAGKYRLIDDFPPSLFFNKFNFYNSYDPTYGHVQYVNETIAVRNGLVSVDTTKNTALIKPDTTNLFPRGGPGRPSVRIISDNTYTHGLFLLDVVHMPWGCGTWPAYWLLGPNWPYTGEIDIIEGVHTIESNSISMHTSPGCRITGSNQLATFQQSNCDTSVNGNTGCGSSLDPSAVPHNYGDGLNRIGGGVYATEWTSEYVQHWFFPRGDIPSDIKGGSPDPSGWGEPAVNQQGPECNIDSHFVNMSIIINTDFCGAWAGNVYNQYPNCPASKTATNSLDSCVDFVGNNPQNLTNAYWEINSIKVYQ
ncbi:glycoside hydrolase family 16 protein, partial [Polychaeton citri CBS 116435]